MDSARNVKIGDLLIEYGYISNEQLNAALAFQRENKGRRIGDVLIELGYISERQMLQALAQRLNYRSCDISEVDVDIEAVALIPHQMAEKYCSLTVQRRNGVVTVVTNDPMNFYGLEEIRQLTGMELEIILCEKAPLKQAISFYYSEVTAKAAAKAANVSSQESDIQELTVEEGDDDTPIINLLNSLIRRAYSTNASDIHIEPFEDKTLVRMRIDGTIVEYVTLQRSVHAPLIARIKILSDLDIAERRIPQDGHCRLNVGNTGVNVRVSLIPTVFGEKAVLRLLAGNSAIDFADSFGMRDEDCKKYMRMLQSPNGIIYMTGPTGSGKTTTLYMTLEYLSKGKINISTIEDPVEKNLERINQMQVNNTAGLTFETGLRALLRQDPDIIMVGETRDAETASISVRAAITGHLVFSTLHTNDAASTIIRLVDMGLEPYMLASSLVGIVAQRLVRKVCPNCVEESDTTEEEREFLGLPGLKRIKRARGCHLCSYTGYSGRVSIHEILVVDAAMRKMITKNVTTDELKEYARQGQGMVTLRDSAARLVADGVTTMEEFLKVAYNA